MKIWIYLIGAAIVLVLNEMLNWYIVHELLPVGPQMRRNPIYSLPILVDSKIKLPRNDHVRHLALISLP